MTRLAAVAIVAVIVAPHAIAAWRAVHIGRTAIGSHRQSVRVGIRLGRWQFAIVAALTILLIGAHQ